MKVVIDIEADGLEDVKNIWLIVCKDIDTGEISYFRDVTSNEADRDAFKKYVQQVDVWIGHNILGYDWPVLSRLLGYVLDLNGSVSYIDTLIISKMADYPRKGDSGSDDKRKHSIEAYGEEFGFPKGTHTDFSKWSQEMEDYCVRDVDIAHLVYTKYYKYINNPDYQKAIRCEHSFQIIVNDLHNNGFAFNSLEATKLLAEVTNSLDILDKQILSAFPPKLKLIREITPKETKHGTLSKTDFRFVTDGDLSIYNGGPFCRCDWVSFNPASHKQIIDVLHDAGWEPVNKTKTRIDLEREVARSKFSRVQVDPIVLADAKAKLENLEKYGWKVDEVNISTLPDSAPKPARLLAQRILLESRRRTLTEWLSLVSPETQRIHGNFFGIGAWTHRMSHQNPNTANIPNSMDISGNVKLYGKEMRSLWIVPKKRLLVGVDAEGIQLRIFAHYINDPEFTNALVTGRKEDKTDPHSLNQRIMGSVCRSRGASKRFIFAFLLGGGIGKLAQILDCSVPQATDALNRLYERYSGLQYLKEEVIPGDAKRGYFSGLDGRPVKILGDTLGTRKHLCMSGYLQNGEKVVMAHATVRFEPELSALDAWLVNLVHDEWQTEVPNDMKIALQVAQLQADSLRIVGEELKLNCPLAGSYWNDDNKDYTIGVNWYQTH